MMREPDLQENSNPRIAGRRTMIKSAAVLLGASALPGSLRGQNADSPSGQTQTQSQRTHPTPFGNKMVGFMLAHEQFPAPKLVELAVAAENSGFDLVATSDHFQPWQANEAHSGQAWVTMGAAVQKTSRIWMGPAVTCPTFRYNPGVVAEAFATLNLFYPGRIFLGIGSGEALNEQAATGTWPNWQERSERLIEAADVIRKLWRGGQVIHKGKFYDINAKLYDQPKTEIPLLFAANGPKAMRRAGQYADGLITDPKTWKEHKPEFEAGVKAAGKDMAKMHVLVEQYVVVGDKKDAEQAAELWRFGPKAFKSYYNIRDPKEIQRRADAEIPLEQVYGDWPVSTDPAAHIKVVNDLFASGVTIANIHTGQPNPERVIDFYGKQVIPKLNRS